MHTAHFLHGAPKAAYRAHPRDASQSPSQSQARIGESIASTRNLATGQCRLQRSASQAAMATALAASLNPPGCDVRSGVLRFPERGGVLRFPESGPPSIKILSWGCPGCVAISGTGVCCDFQNGGKSQPGVVLRFPHTPQIACTVVCCDAMQSSDWRNLARDRCACDVAMRLVFDTRVCMRSCNGCKTSCKKAENENCQKAAK